MNKVILIGNLGADGEFKPVGSDGVLKLRLATSERWTDKQTGEKKEKSEWHSIDLWGPRAEKLAPHMKKGTKLAVEGSIQTRTVDSDDGSKKYFTTIKATSVEFVGGKKGESTAETESTDEIPF